MKSLVAALALSAAALVAAPATAAPAPEKPTIVLVHGAFAPDSGDTTAALVSKFPGSKLGPALMPPVALPGGFHDLYIAEDKFHDAFAPDVSPETALILAAGQRPFSAEAFNEKATAPAWKTVPSWFVYGSGDTAIPPKSLAFMAERAKPREIKVVQGASHVVMVSHPADVVKVIVDAAASVH